MEEKYYLTAQEVAALVPCSLSLAYRLIREWNAKLQKQGKLTIRGRINRRFFEKQMQG